MSVESLARPEVRTLSAYRSAASFDDALRLHANEAPTAIGPESLNRYPEIRPAELQSRLAKRFGVAADYLLVTRGSTEAIDLLIRAFCLAGHDNIVMAPPTFVMYQVYADIQGAGTIRCPLLPERDFVLDVDTLANSCTPESKLIFVCSPNNPTGNVVPRSEIIRLLNARSDKSIVVVDEAYIEFSNTESMAELVTDHENLVVLRTLSKAMALAGARCGAVIGKPSLIRILNAVLPPYALATPVTDCVMRAMSSELEPAGDSRIAGIVAERERLAERLANSGFVEKIWPGQANFLLVRFNDLDSVQQRLHSEHILVRDFKDEPALENCARITIGSPDENDRLLEALDTAEGMRNVG